MRHFPLSKFNFRYVFLAPRAKPEGLFRGYFADVSRMFCGWSGAIGKAENQIIYTIELIQKSLNKDLRMEGVVFTMFDSRTNLSLQVVENVKDTLNHNIYKTIIPRNVRLAEAPSHGLPINLYDSKSAGAESYRLFGEEVIENA